MDSDDRHDTDYANKFVRKAEEIFAGLPKPKDWHTQEEIAGAVDMTRQAIAVWEDEFAKKLETDNFLNSPDFDPPIYNVWKQQGIPPRARGSTFWEKRKFSVFEYSPTRAREHPA